MDFIFILLTALVVAVVLVFLARKGILTDNNKNGVPDVVEQAVEEVKEAVKKPARKKSAAKKAPKNSVETTPNTGGSNGSDYYSKTRKSDNK